MLPADWRARMAEIVRGAEDPDASWFAGGVVLGPLDQIGVYRDQYRLRLGDAVRDELPGFCALVDDAERIDELVFAYLAAHPSQSYTLNRIADAFPAFLATQDVPQAWLEMVALDRAVMDGFEAAEGHTIRPEQLATTPRLRLQPHVRLLRLQHDVHRFRSAVISDEPLPELAEQAVCLVVFRRALKMRHLEVPPSCLAVLEAIGEGAALGDALSEAVAAGADPSVLQERLGDWFRLFAERDLVEATR
ncbi:MAG: putative DNA-binding domain-containing protein [Proteobacteria bacterium]|nr:putative DNA-binding domain-containing protein [Pseudomonadota bacterium]